MAEHWHKFQKSNSIKFSDNLPIDSVEYERRRNRQESMCSIKSLVCCISVLVGKPSIRNNKKKKQRQQQRSIGLMSNCDNDDASFGYNFDDQVMSPRVLTRLAGRGHQFD